MIGRRSALSMLGVLLFLCAFPARGATPNSGTVSPTAPEVTYEGATITGLPVAGPPICIDGAICDTFTVTVEVPDGFSERRDLVSTISWEDSANDIDLSVCPGTEQEDPTCANGVSSLSAGTDSETVVIKNAAAGVYRVVAHGYSGTSSYSGKIGFYPPPAPFRPALVQTPGDLTAETTGDARLIASALFPGGTDMDFRDNLAFVGSFDEEDGGLRIFDIANPRRPRLIGRFPCSGYQNDVGVWRNTVVLGMHDSGETPGCAPENLGGLRIVDVTDPTNPRQTAFVEIGGGGTHTLTIVGDTGYVYANPGGIGTSPDQWPTTIVDIRDRNKPQIVGTWTPPQSLGCHDINVVGNRAYCAGSNVTHIMDITDPVQPQVISSIVNPLIQFHHGAAPSSDGEVLVIADEALFVNVCDPAGVSPAGAYWFYDISDEALPILMGHTSVPGDLNFGAGFDYPCTAHNFNMVPDRRWLVTASYTRGTSIIDFTDPSAPTFVAQVTGTDADTWSSYFYRGFIFASDMNRGFDVIEHPALTALAPAAARPAQQPPAPEPRPTVKSGRALPATGVASSTMTVVGVAMLVAAGGVGAWIGRPQRRRRSSGS